ncbi:MAG: cyclic nucleotide-binding domain-containing protein [Chloroflexota bacterium]
MDFDIHRLPVFAGLREEHIKSILTLIESFKCESGITVIRQGFPADHFYVILKGKVQISFKPYDSSPITVSHVEAGGLFGWSAVIGSEHYTSSAVAIESLEAVRIRGDELRKLSAENPEAGREILNSLASSVSARWKNAHEEVRLMLEKGMK